MACEKVLLLFGDQTAQTAPLIKKLSHQSRHYLFLQVFLQKATEALRCEISRLQPAERNKFFPFESVLDLSETYVKNGVLDVAVSTVLLCIAQLGSLVMFVFFPTLNYYAANAFTAFSLVEKNPRILADTRHSCWPLHGIDTCYCHSFGEVHKRCTGDCS